MSTITGKYILQAMALTLLLMGFVAQASGINGINSGMPNRISMNVTVPKQTQGATFGEKVNAGLHAAGSVVANGASSVIIECGQTACAVVFADGSGERADLEAMTVSPLASQQADRVRKAPAGATLLGSALPGGSILSAAVSSVGNLAGGGAAAASYAATGRMVDGAALSTRSDTPGVIDVINPLSDGDYLLTVVVEKRATGLKDTLKTQVRGPQSQRVRIVLGFSVEAGVLKTKHDTAKNSVGNIR